jgi:hypothetical protein
MKTHIPGCNERNEWTTVNVITNRPCYSMMPPVSRRRFLGWLWYCYYTTIHMYYYYTLLQVLSLKPASTHLTWQGDSYPCISWSVSPSPWCIRSICLGDKAPGHPAVPQVRRVTSVPHVLWAIPCFLSTLMRDVHKISCWSRLMERIWFLCLFTCFVLCPSPHLFSVDDEYTQHYVSVPFFPSKRPSCATLHSSCVSFKPQHSLCSLRLPLLLWV